MTSPSLPARCLLTLLILAFVWSQPLLRGQGGGNPTGLTAQVSGNTVTLEWLAPSAPPVPVTGYVVSAGMSPGTTAVSLPVGNTLTFSVGAPFGVYYVRVAALGASGTLGVSAEVQVVVQPAGLPLPPLSMQATVSGTSVALQWQPNPAGPAATFYQLRAGSAPGQSNIAALTLPATALAFNTTAPPGTYYVRVVAGNAVGIGLPSNEVTVSTAVACTPTAPFTPSATVTPAAVSLRWFARTGPAAAGYRLTAGTASGAANIGVFDFPATTTLISTAATPGRYFVRLAAFNGCGLSAPSNELSFMVPPTNLPSVVGTWDGTITNHVPRSSGRLITNFTLQLNRELPFSSSSAGRFTATGCNHFMLFGGYSSGTGMPFVSMESMACTDGDFGLSFETMSATTIEGPCILGGPSCRFRMTRR